MRGVRHVPSAYRTLRDRPVTVVIPAYDRAELLPRALASVAAQTATPAEVLVVDDGSSDHSAAVGERHGARVIRHERNRGVSAARNTALEAARGEWVAFLDTDDEWLPLHLEGLWRAREGHAAVAHSAVWVERPGREHHAYGVTGRRPRLLTSPAPLVADNFIPLSASLVHRDSARRAGGFDTTLTHAEDLDFWIRLVEQGSVLVLPEIGAIYHLHEGQATKDTGATVEGHRRAIARYRDRPWWPRGALAAMEVRARWDEWRRVRGARPLPGAAALALWLLARPGRLRLLAALLTRRFALRRAGARVDHRGRPVVAVLPGAQQPRDNPPVHLLDLRGLSPARRLASLATRAPATALAATPGQRLLCRVLGIPQARSTAPRATRAYPASVVRGSGARQTSAAGSHSNSPAGSPANGTNTGGRNAISHGTARRKR
jgi:glycosyltransferase involved in cell wall biosynthesis